MTSFEAYYLCVCTTYKKDESDNKKKKDDVTLAPKEYAVISNQNLTKILKGLTKEAIKDFDCVDVYVFFDDRTNLFANYNLTSYVSLAPDNAMLDTGKRLFDKHLITRIFSVDKEGKAIRV